MANWSAVYARMPGQYKAGTTVVGGGAAGGVAYAPSSVFSTHSELPASSVLGRKKGCDSLFRNACAPDEVAHDCSASGCERVTLNVSGLHFVTKLAVLNMRPTTLLGDAERRRRHFDRNRDEYFFDRHRPSFEAIFAYYQYGGRIKRPPTVADDVFLDELEFFGIERETIDEYKRGEGYTEQTYEYPTNALMRKIWMLFEYPESSTAAFFVGLLSVVTTVLSIVIFTMETVPMFRRICEPTVDPADIAFEDDVAAAAPAQSLFWTNQSSSSPPSSSWAAAATNAPTTALARPSIKHCDREAAANASIIWRLWLATAVAPTAEPPIDYEGIFFVVESVCNAWFTFEAVVRFIACPNHLRFFKDVKNLIDIAAIVPYYVSLANEIGGTDPCDGGNALAFLRVVRLIRVFKLTKHSEGLQILMLTFRSSLEGLTLFLLTLMVCILVFSSAMYYSEMAEPSAEITSIPDAFWWAVITMCTVGYGDVTPKGPMGKLVGTVCTLSGVLTLSIPIPIITENFNKFYGHRQRQKSLRAAAPSATLVDRCTKSIADGVADCRRRMASVKGYAVRQTSL